MGWGCPDRDDEEADEGLDGCRVVDGLEALAGALERGAELEPLPRGLGRGAHVAGDAAALGAGRGADVVGAAGVEAVEDGADLDGVGQFDVAAPRRRGGGGGSRGVSSTGEFGGIRRLGVWGVFSGCGSSTIGILLGVVIQDANGVDLEEGHLWSCVDRVTVRMLIVEQCLEMGSAQN